MLCACLEYWLELRYCSVIKVKVSGEVSMMQALLLHVTTFCCDAAMTEVCQITTLSFISQMQTITRVGIAGVVTGEVIRKTAMVTALLNVLLMSTQLPHRACCADHSQAQLYT